MKTRKQEQSRDRSIRKNACRLDKTKLSGNRQPEKTGIKTQGIMGKMGDTWRGMETRQVKQIRGVKTGETDQCLTPMCCFYDQLLVRNYSHDNYQVLMPY